MGCCATKSAGNDLYIEVFQSFPIRSILINILFQNYFSKTKNDLLDFTETQFQELINILLLPKDEKNRNIFTQYWLDFYRSLNSQTRTLTIKICLAFLCTGITEDIDIKLIADEMKKSTKSNSSSNINEISKKYEIPKNITKNIIESYVKLLTVDTIDHFKFLISDSRKFKVEYSDKWERSAIEKYVEITFFNDIKDKGNSLINIYSFLKEHYEKLRNDDAIRKDFAVFSEKYREKNPQNVGLNQLKETTMILGHNSL